ncbi:MAG TPA: glycosyltransferase family 2 protein [Thermoleophilaceae bacterium]|jgi:GT2 family glycosyltransferase
MEPLVSLVLPNKNNDPVLDLFFEKLEAHTDHPNFEVIAVDDGSTDRSRAILRRWRDSGRFPRFKLIEREASGIIRTLNAGLAEAEGEIVARLDGDATIETPGWLGRMVEFLGCDERVGVVVAKIVFDSGQIHSFGMNIVGPQGVHDRGTRITEPVGRRTLDINVERPNEWEAEGGDEIAEVDGAIGCCTMFRRSLAEEIGGFDTIYDPVGFEDFDFALGARRLGRKVFFFPEVRVIHRVSMRNPRTDNSRRELWLWRARRRFGDAFPLWLRKRIAAAAKLGDHDPARIALLERHYESWRRKWGFDPINPDMDSVLARYGGTEVCWAYDDERRETGRRIVAGYLARGRAPAS